MRRRHNWFVGSVGGGWGVSGHPQGVGWAGSWRFDAAECADVELFGWFRSQVVRLTHGGGGGWLGWFLPPESPWLVGLFGLHDTRIWLSGWVWLPKGLLGLVVLQPLQLAFGEFTTAHNGNKQVGK